MHPEELLKFSVSWALAAGGHTFDKAKFVKAMYGMVLGAILFHNKLVGQIKK